MGFGMLRRLRQIWLDLHLWLGVGLFIPFALLGLTGSVLTFKDEFARLTNPARYAVSPGPMLPLADLLARANIEAPQGYAPMLVRLPEEAGNPVVVVVREGGGQAGGQRSNQGAPREGVTRAAKQAAPAAPRRANTRNLYIDPASGRVLDVENPRTGLFAVLHSLHGTLLIPDIGRKVVGWMGWGMLISSLTGIWLWWPRNGAALLGLRWRRGPRTTFNLHHRIGFWIAIPLAILSATGVYISFPQSARGLTALVAPMSPAPQRPPGAAGPLRNPHLTADSAASAARAAAPDASLRSLTLPTRGRDGAPASWRAELRRAGGGAPIIVSVDDATGQTEQPGRAALAGDGAALAMRRLHDGVNQSMIWRVVIFLAGLAPAILGVTGIVMWLRRRAARRPLARERELSTV